MAWARTYLKAFGLLTNSERAVWSLTPLGRETSEVDKTRVVREVQKLRKGTPRKRGDEESEDETDEEAAENSESPDWKLELLECLLALSPAEFERLCQRILRENGFVEVRVTGRSGDHGIDGVGLLRLQEVLTFHVIFQCKRWKDAVSAGTIRDFRGAMQGRSDKGLVMTTSYFTPEAIREATRDGAPAVDLIDGERWPSF
jgi:restriction system protein